MSPSAIYLEVQEVVQVENGVQVSMGDKITDMPWVDRQRTICGGDYEHDLKSKKICG